MKKKYIITTGENDDFKYLVQFVVVDEDNLVDVINQLTDIKKTFVIYHVDDFMTNVIGNFKL